MTFFSLSQSELRTELAALHKQYQHIQERNLTLDITRGKPSMQQLDLSNKLLELPANIFQDSQGNDLRNYGGLQGIASLRAIFSDIIGMPADNIVADNNSSLALMHDILTFACLYGTVDGTEPWLGTGQPVKFLCPVPGYDRHFAITQRLGMELISIPMCEDGPDVDLIESLVAEDPTIKGMWLVPVYSNPTGTVISQKCARRLATMRSAANDFRIFWDNAYMVHSFVGRPPQIPMFDMCQQAGNSNRLYIFSSTSKITFAGAGVSFVGFSDANREWYLRHSGIRSIGPDKINQLRHAMFFGDTEGVWNHMVGHQNILKPKFDLVQNIFDQRLGDAKVAHWTDPQGGYFVSLDVVPGTAKRVVSLAKAAGIALTQAGATYPYGVDPEDKTIRIAPSVPPVDELTIAIDGVSTCVLLAAAEKHVNECEGRESKL